MDATLATPTAPAAPLPGWRGAAAFDAGGARVGVVADVFFDTRTRAPAWVLLGLPDGPGRYVLAPARGLRQRVAGVQLACSADDLRAAPRSAAPPDGLSRRHALALAAHFGVRCGAGPWHGVAEPTLTAAVRSDTPLH